MITAAGTITSAMHRLAGALLDLAIVYKALAVAGCCAVLCHRLLLKPSHSKAFPLFGPIEIALAMYLVSAGGLGRRLYSMIRRYDGSLFGLSSRHQVLIDLPSVDRFMSQGHHALEVLPHQFTLLTRVFGSPDTPKFFQDCDTCIKALLAVVEREFVNDAASTAAMQRGEVQHKITSLVTLSDQSKDRKPWERSANVRFIHGAHSGQADAVEADFLSLVRDFGANIAIPVLYGQDFLDRNPDLLDDFWKFDNELFPLLMVGVPPWMPFKMMRDGLAARSRVISALETLYKRIDQYQKGQPVDFGADMSDVGIALNRNDIYNKHDVRMKHRADMDFSFFWGQNGNTQPLLFWFLTYIYSTPGLVDILRKEIAPWVVLSTEGPVEIKSIDIPSLGRECPLMKSALFETFRLGSEATSIRYVARPMTVVDGKYNHHLQPGTFVSAPHSVVQKDPAVFPDPDKFVPDRFLELDAETGKQVPRYGRLRPWGIGSGSCKGRTFAEKEILTLGAAVMSVWDIEPAGGTWKVPAMIPGTGAKKPVQDIRVLLRRRLNS
ncbi:cytochrome P450 [Xylariales sp. AK1849]|nr:cytochrome P450 [Xylariales sp. AK1849]